MKLYHYVHCPFCIRVRMGLGFLSLPFQSIVVAYNDEVTPVKLSGKKMLPIIVSDNGVAQNESLDILQKQDFNDKLKWKIFLENKIEVERLIDKIGSPVHSLCMPYWIWTPEFDENSRKYFQEKKEIKRGPFKKLVKNQIQYLTELQAIIAFEIETKLEPFYRSECLTIIDIMIASHLWGLYIVPEFQFSPKMHEYLQRVKRLCHFDYHEDFWK